MPSIEYQILQCTEAKAIENAAHVQTLWSGYGTIKRYTLEGGKHRSVIVKHILLPESGPSAKSQILCSGKLLVPTLCSFNQSELPCATTATCGSWRKHAIAYNGRPQCFRFSYPTNARNRFNFGCQKLPDLAGTFPWEIHAIGTWIQGQMSWQKWKTNP